MRGYYLGTARDIKKPRRAGSGALGRVRPARQFDRHGAPPRLILGRRRLGLGIAGLRLGIVQWGHRFGCGYVGHGSGWYLQASFWGSRQVRAFSAARELVSADVLLARGDLLRLRRDAAPAGRRRWTRDIASRPRWRPLKRQSPRTPGTRSRPCSRSSRNPSPFATRTPPPPARPRRRSPLPADSAPAANLLAMILKSLVTNMIHSLLMMCPWCERAAPPPLTKINHPEKRI